MTVGHTQRAQDTYLVVLGYPGRRTAMKASDQQTLEVLPKHQPMWSSVANKMTTHYRVVAERFPSNAVC